MGLETSEGALPSRIPVAAALPNRQLFDKYAFGKRPFARPPLAEASLLTT